MSFNFVFNRPLTPQASFSMPRPTLGGAVGPTLGTSPLQGASRQEATSPFKSFLGNTSLVELLFGFLFLQLLPQLLENLKANSAPAPGASSNTPSGTAASGQGNLPLDKEDLVNYFLAGSKGGTASTVEVIEGRYARPGSRFASAGPSEFDAVTAAAYTGQFKSYALGLDAVFNPGDNINQLADNVSKAMQTQFTPEADILSKVAAVYRGDLTGVNTYNNRALKDLLVKWGRSDLANKPGVGVTDVESIGGVVKALNEEQNPTIRKAWLQEIFDFQNNTPNSPSGAVPNLKPYQDAISIVRNGQLDQLLSNYRQGIRTGDINSGTLPGTVRPIPTA